MLHRIRNYYGIKTEQLSGVVEVNETFIGGKVRSNEVAEGEKRDMGRSTKTKTASIMPDEWLGYNSLKYF